MSPSTTRPSLVVVITGASSGIGRACAHAFARDKARIVLAARERRPLEDVAAECRSLGAQALVVPADVADADAMRELVAAAIERFGAIDVWLNNVGIGAVGRFDVTPIGAHRRVVEVNLLGQINGAHAVLPHFRQQAPRHADQHDLHRGLRGRAAGRVIQRQQVWAARLL